MAPLGARTSRGLLGPLLVGLVSAAQLSPQERAFGIYGPGRYGWLLDDVYPLRESIPAKGMLGLWEWEPPDDLEARLLAKPDMLPLHKWGTAIP